MEVYLRYCPGCGEEYQPHMVTCVECGTALEDLVEGEEKEVLRPQEAALEDDLPPGEYRVLQAHIWPTPDLMREFAKAGVPVKVGPSRQGVTLQVRDEDRAAAIALLEAQGELPKQPDAGDPAVGEQGGPCPACGTAIRPGTPECPECGLVLTGDIGCDACGSTAAPVDGLCPSCGGKVE
jgi:hypothetical protein